MEKAIHISDFDTVENQHGIRMSWNMLPPDKLTLTNPHIPLGCIYTPMKDIENLVLAQYTPQSCSKCQSILNAYCKVDPEAQAWLCLFCLHLNAFPQEYLDHINKGVLPFEMLQEYATMEYLHSDPSLQNLPPTIFMFLIETCLVPDKFQVIKENILKSINLIPANAWIGLVSFGKSAFVHQLSVVGSPKSYEFDGEKDYTTAQVFEILGIKSKDDLGSIQRFLLPISDCEKMLKTVIETLQPDSQKFGDLRRPIRCTGTAISIAVSLLETAYTGQGSRLLSFTHGACTIGRGQVASLESNADEKKDFEKYSKKATDYYQSITERAIKAGSVIDIFSFGSEELGLREMSSLCEKTGGVLIYRDILWCQYLDFPDFCHKVLHDIFSKFFEKDTNGDLKLGACGNITIHLTKELRVSGAIGPCKSLKKQTPLQADDEIGESGTSQWYLGGLNSKSTIAFYLDLSSDFKVTGLQEKSGYIQFVTKYRHSGGSYHLRVTTMERKFAVKSEKVYYELAQGFDQEAACMLLARLAFFKRESEPLLEVVRWIDSTLKNLVKRFGEYTMGDETSFRLPKEFRRLPEFMFRLRVNDCLRRSSISDYPSDQANFRAALYRENTENCITMIIPLMLMYSLENLSPTPVILDISNMKDDVILILDTYFHLFIWKGERIRGWEKAGYQDFPEYAYFKELLQNPADDANLIMQDRFPAPPRLWQVHPGHVSERRIKRVTNPVVGVVIDDAVQQSGDFIDGGDNGDNMPNLQVFISNLIKSVVSNPMHAKNS